MYTLIIIGLFLLTSGCATPLSERNKLDYKPAAFGPVMDGHSMRYDFLNRSSR